ncbi:YdeI/OmpD-associated family protein [Actinosynnema sp. NPDC047251]|uniref:YdeI/OmpD-associated family protein n=1 Tax=Saccharothrix espanaensis TaxID=103731 RepID=UPI0002F785A9|nr:YdeI/OmpD-associated family protein [Saccharothrix espanaensis]
MEPLDFADAAQWDHWLTAHHGESAGVWLKIAKKNSGRTSVTITEALDGALCHGWIDGHRRGLDDEYYLQRYSPRRAGSSWSRVNVAKAEALIAAGRMRDAGWAAIRAAQAHGRWAAAYESQATATVPADLAEALERDPAARERFEALDRTSRYGLLLRLMKARTPRARSAQVDRIVAGSTQAA